MSPAAYQRLLPFLLLFLFFGGLATHTRFGGREIYPLSSWSLFSTVPEQSVLYVARIRAVEGRPFDPPVQLQASPVFNPFPDPQYNANVLKEFGIALESGDAARIRFLRERVEDNLLVALDIDWEMVRIDARPLDWDAPDRIRTRSLGLFHKAARPAPDRGGAAQGGATS
jgi:hypothetical protein